jgi:hypothetical protein
MTCISLHIVGNRCAYRWAIWLANTNVKYEGIQSPHQTEDVEV